MPTIRRLFVSVAVLGLATGTTRAACPLPYDLTNGQPADADQVMANFNALAACIDSAGPSAVRELGPFAPPAASSFTFVDTVASITPSVSDIAGVGMLYSVAPSTTSIFPGVYRVVPASPPWTLTARVKYPTLMGNYPGFGLYIKDTAGKMLGLDIESRTSQTSLILKRNNSNTDIQTNAYLHAVYDAPSWLRINYDGVNIKFHASWDGQNWLHFWSETKTAFLNGNLQYVGISGRATMQTSGTFLAGTKMGGIVTYWDIDDDPASGRMQ